MSVVVSWSRPTSPRTPSGAGVRLRVGVDPAPAGDGARPPGAPSWWGRDETQPRDWAERERLVRWMTELGAKFPDVRVSEQDVHEPEARALVTRGAQNEIVVVGSHHHSAVASALGRALAVSVVEHAPTTVVVVPGQPVA